MDARLGMAAATFDPLSQLIQEEDSNTLLLHLPGFTKEQLRVQLTRSRVLKISGSRPIGDDKLSSFQKDFPISENIDSHKITARFEDGVLYVKQPKLIIVPGEQKTPPLLPPETAQQHQQTAPNAADHPKHTGAEKSKEKKEEKTSTESEGGRKHAPAETGGADSDDQKKAAAAAAASEREKISGSNVGKVDDYRKVDMLKKGREKMIRILLLLFAFALGMYVSKLPWFSNSTDVDT